MTRLQLLGCLLLGLPVLGFAAAALGQERFPTIGDREELVARCMMVSRFFAEKYNQDDAPMVIEPVALPYGENLLGNNSHFGWPVATRAGDALIVVFLRQPQHTPRWGIEKPKDEHLSRAVMTRSTDGGKTWSKPVDMRSFVETPTDGCRLAFGSGMVTRANGEVVLVSPYGVFISADQGATWEHLPGAYGEDDLPGPVANNGPQLLEHPEYGIVSFGHGEAEELIIRYSTDGGRDWEQLIYEMPEPWARAIEPTVMMHEGALVMMARGHGEARFEPERRTWRYMQAFAPSGWLPWEPALTTIRVTDIRDEIDVSGYGPWSQDTVALDYNPVTERFEAVCTNRNGGGQGREQLKQRQGCGFFGSLMGEVALEEHFGDGSAASEVAVDLKRRVGAEQIGITAAAVVVAVLAGEVFLSRWLEEVGQELVGA